jgi:hypothetical protein
MAERDRVIKSGQLTLPRLVFLAVVGGVVVFTVYRGGIFLSIGYWLLTIAICGLLFLIAIDYGIKMDKIEVHHPHTPVATPAPAIAATESVTRQSSGPAGPRVKRKSSRPAKRRR